jgi:hypothetical protein
MSPVYKLTEAGSWKTPRLSYSRLSIEPKFGELKPMVTGGTLASDST